MNNCFASFLFRVESSNVCSVTLLQLLKLMEESQSAGVRALAIAAVQGIGRPNAPEENSLILSTLLVRAARMRTDKASGLLFMLSFAYHCPQVADSKQSLGLLFCAFTKGLTVS